VWSLVPSCGSLGVGTVIRLVGEEAEARSAHNQSQWRQRDASFAVLIAKTLSAPSDEAEPLRSGHSLPSDDGPPLAD
jgi:hypothetical protein